MGRDKMTKTLYVSDLDGTLLDKDSRLSAASAKLLNQAISKGAAFTIATARTPATISTLLKDVDMCLPAIAMTGSVRWDFKSHLYSHPQFIDAEIAERLFEIYRRHQLPVFQYSLGSQAVEVRHFGEFSPLERQFAADRSGSDYKRFINDESPTAATLQNTLLFYSMQPTSRVKALLEEVKGVEGICSVYYHDIFGPEIALLEVFSCVTSKASAVKSLATELGAERIVVFGDNVNDLPMMNVATHAVAVDNAISQVKMAADEVIGCNDDDSVAKWILNDLLAQ